MDDSGEEAGARRAMRAILDVRVGGAATTSRGSSAHARDRDMQCEAGSRSEMAIAGRVARFRDQCIHWPYSIAESNEGACLATSNKLLRHVGPGLCEPSFYHDIHTPEITSLQ